MEDSGVVERLPRAQSTVAEYHLSEAGRELKAVIEALGEWGVRWAFGDPRPEEYDAGLLVWKIHQRINRELLPERGTVVEFDFTGPKGRGVWLLLERREKSVCVTPPGFDSDLIVRADVAFFYRVRSEGCFALSPPVPTGAPAQHAIVPPARADDRSIYSDEAMSVDSGPR